MTTGQFDAERRFIVDSLESVRQLTCDIHYKRSSDSPPYFDQLVREQDVDCKAARKMLATRGDWLKTSDASAVLPNYGQGSVSKQFASENFKFVNDAVETYNKSATKRRLYKNHKATTSLEVTVTMFAPYLAAVALSLALAGLAIRPRQSAER
ncbi:hypothetical protein [Novosphingobium sp. 9U]|uniref:hypothetical protein n=1 Tax=Novosphingobium sp. 9U TaxID=2653158 RepID=UPI001F1D51E7|nr:hypothetical protein [Novosphingobium sp. 9U]